MLLNTFDVNDLVEAAHLVIERCYLGSSGQYKRYAVPTDKPDAQSINAYGVADAANLLYTLNAMPHDEVTRRGFVNALNQMQDPQTGLYAEGTHHQYHTTAHCVAALELFEGLPTHPLKAMMPDATPQGIVAKLESLDWIATPWRMSHQGAGVYTCLKLSRQLDKTAERAFESAYFDWVISQFDAELGMLRRGCLPGQHEDAFPIHGHMAGTFHYLFNMESARVPLPYPEKTIDTCLAMYRDNQCPGLGCSTSFITIDWVYCLSRALRQCGHRFAEVQTAQRHVAEQFITFLRELDQDKHQGFNDLHSLFGCFCALAEWQTALPGLIKTDRPLRLVLDRRPFI